MGNAVPVGHVLLLSILIISCANQIGAAFPKGDNEVEEHEVEEEVD